MTGAPPLRDALKAQGLFARKALGQHFLLDETICARIAAAAGDLRAKPVLEIGPGPGGLTRALLNAGADPLFAIEKDARFVDFLQPLAVGSEARLRIIEADALEIDEAALLSGARTTIVANLPYNVGTPLLVKWLKAGPWRGDMVLMFQKEVAERIVAQPGEPAYGRLAVLAQARCAAKMVLRVPAGAFSPPPKVDSAVVHLTDKPDAYAHLDALERVTAAAFGQRRKMLRSALKTLTPDSERLLHAASIEPTARAEEIGLAGFLALTEAWRAGAP
ncbi:MAG: 16S rRNA (adenine(1518)-N(6)/adenine(1519)-N(6))-dimethyltransferase RsmA [Alphaproteobacteria bacterium]|nr:16S rRNA (adenine(1518)-N(6)/adenine(1519)-N(6))-dimethyltransferase RsmA [Alphaproteobacteria bacterium]